jgi:hypothetical protein
MAQDYITIRRGKGEESIRDCSTNLAGVNQKASANV